MSKWMVCEPPWLQPHAIKRAEEAQREAAKRWSKLTEEQRARELGRKEWRRKVSDFLAGALLLVLVFGLTTALIEWLFKLPALPAVLFSAILFLALWIWSVRNEVSDLSNKIVETAPDADPTGRSARDGG